MLSSFALVGICATATYLVISNLLILWGGVAPGPASIGAYIAGMCVSFFGQSRLTFGVERNTFGQMLRFCILSAVGLTISYVAAYLFITEYGLHPTISTFLIAAIITIISFVAMRLWVFAARS